MKEIITSKRWDDIVFENRNHEYGAYIMRRFYPGHLAAATMGTLVFVTLVLAYPAIAKFFMAKEEAEISVPVRQQTVLLEQPPPILPDQPPPPKLDVPPPVKKLIKFLPPKVTEKEIVEETIPTVAEIKKTETSTETVEGEGEVKFEEPVPEVTDAGIDPNETFMVVEQMPEFPGGMQGLFTFFGNHMKYPNQARRMGIEGTVYVSFVIDADGKLIEPAIVKGIGSGLDEEALRVLKLMPPWKPGKQRGRPVRVRFTLPLKFRLGEI